MKHLNSSLRLAGCMSILYALAFMYVFFGQTWTYQLAGSVGLFLLLCFVAYGLSYFLIVSSIDRLRRQKALKEFALSCNLGWEKRLQPVPDGIGFDFALLALPLGTALALLTLWLCWPPLAYRLLAQPILLVFVAVLASALVVNRKRLQNTFTTLILKHK